MSLQTLRDKSFITRQGVSMLGISNAGESIGFRTNGVKISFDQLVNEIELPCILHWNQNHFVVCYKIKNKRSLFTKKEDTEYKISIADPGGAKFSIDREGFEKCWISSKLNNKKTGTALLLTPTPEFYQTEDDDSKGDKGLTYFWGYLRPYKSQILQPYFQVTTAKDLV